MKKYADVDYTNSEVSAVIDEIIHSERDRRVLKMWLCDSVPQERIAEVEDMSPAQVGRIVRKGREKVFRRMKLI